MTKHKKRLLTGIPVVIAIAALLWFRLSEPVQPFRLQFLYLTNDAAKGSFAVMQMEHNLPYVIGAHFAWFQRLDADGFWINRYHPTGWFQLTLDGGNRSEIEMEQHSLQLNPQFTQFHQILVRPPPESGKWRASLELGLPDNPGCASSRPLKIRIVDGIDSVVHWLPLSSDVKLHSYLWAMQKRMVWSEPFDLPPPPASVR